MSERFGDWIQTYSGGKAWPLDLRPEDIRFEDIAHSLALLNRFTGHVREPYSVAQHSFHVSQHCGEYGLYGLLHDAAEAYLGDHSRPVKRSLHVPRDGHMLRLGDFESAVEGAIYRRFGLADPDSSVLAAVKRADDLLLATEARDLMHQPLAEGWSHVPANGFPVLPESIVPWDWKTAKLRFWERFYHLGGRTS